MSSRRAISWKSGLALFFGVLFGLVAIGVWGYFRYLHYEPVAARHLPADSRLAARLDIEQMVMFEPVRKQLWPLIDEFSAGNGSGPRGTSGASRLQRLSELSGVELGASVREIVLGQSSDGWVLLIGGQFPAPDVSDAINQLLREDGVPFEQHGAVSVLSSGVALSQAEDGVIIVASDAERARAARVSQDTAQRLGLPVDSAGGFALERRAIEGQVPTALTAMIPPLKVVNSVERASGRLVLEEVSQLRIKVELTPGPTPAVERVQRLVDVAGGVGTFVQALAPAARLLRAAEVQPAGPHAAAVVVPVDSQQIADIAAGLAQAIRLYLLTSEP